jgi:NAD(P)-dependent dehydrogenase (short-subunit alcohol dehydrogenase family)
MRRFAGKVALVTGAGGGLGARLAVRLAEEGAALGLTDLSADTLARTAVAVETAGGSCVRSIGDVAEEATISGLVNDAIESYGRLDVLCNVAGISPPIPIAAMTKRISTG